MILSTGCGDSSKSTESQNRSIVKQVIPKTDNSTLKVTQVTEIKSTVLTKEIVSIYLQLKNALTNDNSTDAASFGKTLEASFKNFNKSSLNDTQMKVFEDLEIDAKEHAEHIGENGGNISHQREHFELLSKDIYNLVKTFGGGQVLYKDFCPMYNNGKGAFWISEIKEIKNPYYGKTMLTCGTIEEEIK